jgi:flagellin-specific chaperone FliS
VVVATLSTPCAEDRPSDGKAADPALPLSVTLLDGARSCVEMARDCIDRGIDPRPHLRWAMTRIRKLPAALAPPGDTEILAILADLTEYMCRELRSVRDPGDLATLERMYDLLREIRGAWVTTDTVSAGPV